MTDLTIKREEPLIEGYAAKAGENEGVVLGVAAALGAVSIEAMDRYGGMYRLYLPKDRAIALTFGERREGGRIFARGAYPTHLGTLYYIGDKADDSASVAIRRGPHVIANEIRRRVLPAYEENLAKLAERKAAEEKAGAERDNVAKYIAEILGKAPGDGWHSSRGDYRAFSVNPDHSSLYGDFMVAAGGSVEISLRSVPPILAGRIAAVVAEHMKGDK